MIACKYGAGGPHLQPNKDPFLNRAISSVPPRVSSILAFFYDWIFPPRPESTEKAILERILSESDIVVEAGARIGGSTLLMSKLVGEKGMVYVFEPNPYAFRVLKHHTRMSSNIQIHNLALGDAHTKRYLSIEVPFGRSSGASLFSKTKYKVPVVVTTIEEATKRFHIPAIDVLVIDAEGAELSILRGASDSLKGLKFAYIECHSSLVHNVESRVSTLLAEGGLLLEERRTDPNEPDISVNVYRRVQ